MICSCQEGDPGGGYIIHSMYRYVYFKRLEVHSVCDAGEKPRVEKVFRHSFRLSGRALVATLGFPLPATVPISNLPLVAQHVWLHPM